MFSEIGYNGWKEVEYGMRRPNGIAGRFEGNIVQWIEAVQSVSMSLW